MKIEQEQIWRNIEQIRRCSLVIHNITNYVVMNNTANALLALGASPVMAHAPEEVADMVKIAGALVINIGTLSKDWVKAMNQPWWRQREKASRLFDPGGRRHTLSDADRPGPGQSRGTLDHSGKRFRDHGHGGPPSPN